MLRRRKGIGMLAVAALGLLCCPSGCSRKLLQPAAASPQHTPRLSTTPKEGAKELVETRLNVTGMTWGGCAADVLGALKAVPGVTKAEVNLKAGTTTVLYDRKKVKAADLVKTINAISHHGRSDAFKASVLPAKSRGIGQGQVKTLRR